MCCVCGGGGDTHDRALCQHPVLPSPGRMGSMSLFQRTPASWTPPQPHNREQRGGGCLLPPSPSQKRLRSVLPAAPSPSPPAPGHSPAPWTHLLLLLLGLGRGEKRQRLVTAKGGGHPPPQDTPRSSWARTCPYLKRGEAIADSHCHRGLKRCQLSWGKRGVSECWGVQGGLGGVRSLPGFLLLLEPHGFQALGAGDEGDVPPLLH